MYSDNEYLQAFVWFVTRFNELARVLAERPGVKTMHMMVNINYINSVSPYPTFVFTIH